MKKLKKGVIDITTTGVIGGVGASVLTNVGGTAATGAASALDTMGGFMKPIATIHGAGAVMRQMKGLQPKKKKLL